MKKFINSSEVKNIAKVIVLCCLYLLAGNSVFAQVICNSQFTHSPGSTLNSIHFTPAPNPAGATYLWTFGDGTSSGNVSPTHVYAPGNYQACLTVTVISATGNVLCTSTHCDSIHIGTAVNCNSQFTHSPGSALNSVHFTPAPNPAGATYLWTFGDGTSSSNVSPTHIYAPGNYQACLTVTVMNPPTGNVLCTSTHCDSIHIGTIVNCNSQFTYSPGSALNSVHFTPALNPAGATYLWTFGDGTSSSNVSPTHVYAPGNYQACLTVTVISATGNVLCTSTHCDSIHIGTAVNCNSQFTHSPGLALNSVHFTPAPNPAGATYLWTFGDGTSSSNVNPTHVYAPGNYQACLTVTVMSPAGNILCASTHCDSIHIPSPVANCTAAFTYQKLSSAPLTYAFNNQSSPNATRFLWHFGDAKTSKKINPVHHYANAGQYQVCVTMFDTVHHCSRTYCNLINVNFIFANNMVAAERTAGEADNIDVSTDKTIVTVFPNPATDNATLHIENAKSEISFIMYNGTGKQVLQNDNLRNGDFEINNRLSPGIYYYRALSNGNTIESGKLMIIK